MKCVLKYIKKRRLIRKYTPNYSSQLHLYNLMKDDPEFLAYYRHIIYCELRCVRRLKSL